QVAQGQIAAAEDRGGGDTARGDRAPATAEEAGPRSCGWRLQPGRRRLRPGHTGGTTPARRRPPACSPAQKEAAMTPLVQALLPVVENVHLARDTYRIRLRGPELARAIRPGQFVMLRLPGITDPLLGRPFALYDTFLEGRAPAGIDVVYLVVGKMT